MNAARAASTFFHIWYYLEMEYLEGETLEQALAGRVSAGQAFGAREATGVARAIAGAVHAAHTQGVLHRDLKPSNVMLEKSGRVVITSGDGRSIAWGTADGRVIVCDIPEVERRLNRLDGGR